MNLAYSCRPTLRQFSQNQRPALLALFLGSTFLISQPAFSQTMVDGGIVATAPQGTVTVTPSGVDITPIAGVAGIDFDTDQVATLNSDTGDNKIVTSGADGIRVTTWGGDITINHRGEIEAAGARGIYAQATNGGVTMDGAGDITSEQAAIYTDARLGDGTIAWNGALTSTAGTAVWIYAANGAVSLSGSGNIHAVDTAVVLDARSYGNNASLNWSGDITSTGARAVWAHASNGAASIDGEGTVLAIGDALTADARWGDATIDWSGSVTSTTGRGLYAYSSNFATTIDASGSVLSYGTAIEAISTANLATTVRYTGDLESTNGRGISTFSASGSSHVEGSGTIRSAEEAIRIEILGQREASLTWDGVIDSKTTGYAVHINANNGDLNSTTSGAIYSRGGGIFGNNHVGWENGSLIIPVLNISHSGLIYAAGHGIHANSSQGNIWVGVIGRIDAGGDGIRAQGHNAGTVLVEHQGEIEADANGIHVQNIHGSVTVDQSGTITAGDVGIYTSAAGASRTLVEKAGTILAYSHGIHSIANAGVIDINVYYGDIRSTAGHGILATKISDGGSTSVNVQGDVTAALDGIRTRAINSATDVTLSMGTILAGGDGINHQGWGLFTATIEADGEVVGGAGQSGIAISDSLSSTITNRGIIRSIDGYDGSAILAVQSDTNVENFGLIQGNVTLEPWNSVFNNHTGGRFESGTEVSLGSFNFLNNHGTLAPGGDDRITTTHLNGSLRSYEGGKLAYDIDMTNDVSDRIDVDGIAVLHGALALRFMSYTGVESEYTLLTAGDSVNADELTLSDFVRGDLRVVDGGQTVKLDFYGLDMVSEDSSLRSQSIGHYLNRRLATGDQDILGFVNLIVDAHTAAQAETVFDILTPAALDGVAVAQGQALSFASALMSCPLPSGIAAPLREGTCDWARVDYGHQERDGSGWSSESDVMAMSFGMQRPLGDGLWHIGIAGGTSFAETQLTTGGEVSNTSFNAGVALKYAPGPAKFSAVFNTNWGDVSSTRTVDIAGTTETLIGDTNVAAYNLRLRGAYLMGTDSLYFMPMVDLNASHIRTKAYTETGGSAALSVEAMNDTVFSLSPALEFGTNLRYADGGVLRAFATVGATLNSQAGVSLTSALASDLTGVEGFTLTSGGDKQVINLSAGISAFQVSGWTADARIGVSFGDTTNDQQASVKFRKSF